MKTDKESDTDALLLSVVWEVAVSSVGASLDRLCNSLSCADTGAYDTWYGLTTDFREIPLLNPTYLPHTQTTVNTTHHIKKATSYNLTSVWS